MILEPLNVNYNEPEVIQAISTALTEFYTALSQKLDKININKILKRKNPYLYRAKGINNATQVVDRLLSAYISSSEETIFGNTFLNPLPLPSLAAKKP